MNGNRYAVIAALIQLLALAVQAHADDLVVVMGPGSIALTKDQVANVYLGRSNSLKPLDLPVSDSLREAFYKKATDRDLAQVKAVWSRLVFTGQGQPPKELAGAAEVKKAVATDPKAIGYIHKADVDASIQIVLALN